MHGESTRIPESHMGYVKTILSTGYVSPALFYPITHILSAEIIQITGIKLLDLSKLLPLFFGILFVPFMYLFSRSILKDKREVILSTLLSCAFIAGWYLNFTPNALANLFIPLVLMIIVKSYSDIKNRMKWSILLIIMVLLFPPFHPVATIFLLIFILTINLPFNLFKFLKISSVQRNIREIKIQSKFTLALLLIVFSITWISSFFIWSSTVKNLYTLFTEGGSTAILSLTNQINYANGYGYNIFEYILKLDGGLLVILVLSFIGLYFTLKSKNLYPKKNILPLFGPLLIVILVIIAFYFLNIGFGPLRMTVYLIILGTVIAGYTLNHILKLNQKSRLKTPFLLIIFLVLSATFINGILILYPSPYISSTSLQTTQDELDGMGWLLHNKNSAISIIGISVSPVPFENFFNSTTTNKAALPPYHFGYDNSSSLSDSYTKDKYLVVSARDKSIYSDIFPDLSNIRWTSSDFDKLKSDNGLNDIYVDGGNEIYYVNARG